MSITYTLPVSPTASTNRRGKVSGAGAQVGDVQACFKCQRLDDLRRFLVLIALGTIEAIEVLHDVGCPIMLMLLLRRRRAGEHGQAQGGQGLPKKMLLAATWEECTALHLLSFLAKRLLQ
jgi:hypothetical protein